MNLVKSCTMGTGDEPIQYVTSASRGPTVREQSATPEPHVLARHSLGKPDVDKAIRLRLDGCGRVVVSVLGKGPLCCLAM